MKPVKVNDTRFNELSSFKAVVELIPKAKLFGISGVRLL
jgi:hypothetical protein